MSNHRVLLDTFADARRTWDDLVGLQPDVRAAGGHLEKGDLIELERRVESHRAAVDMLVDALETEPPDTAGLEKSRAKRAPPLAPSPLSPAPDRANASSRRSCN